MTMRRIGMSARSSRQIRVSVAALDAADADVSEIMQARLTTVFRCAYVEQPC
jgi:hypothetical protein